VWPTLSGVSVALIRAIACGLDIAPRIGLRSTNAVAMGFGFWLAGLLILDRGYELLSDHGFSIIVQSRTKTPHSGERAVTVHTITIKEAPYALRPLLRT